MSFVPQKLDKVKIASVRRLAVREAVKVCIYIYLFVCLHIDLHAYSPDLLLTSVGVVQ